MERTGTVAVLGESARIEGFALAGALVLPAEDPAAVRDSWRDLPADVVIVILTEAAALTLGPVALESTGPLTVVMPS
jgi:vacuolar-type H+-ATPase subunit F/Vma7